MRNMVGVIGRLFNDMRILPFGDSSEEIPMVTTQIFLIILGSAQLRPSYMPKYARFPVNPTQSPILVPSPLSPEPPLETGDSGAGTDTGFQPVVLTQPSPPPPPPPPPPPSQYAPPAPQYTLQFWPQFPLGRITPSSIENSIRKSSRNIHSDGEMSRNKKKPIISIVLISGIGEVSKFSFFKRKEFYDFL